MRALVMFSIVAMMYSLAASANPSCQNFGQDTSALGGDFQQAFKYFDAYYDAWNNAANLASQHPLSQNELGQIINVYYADNLSIMQNDSKAVIPPVILDAGSFTQVFLRSQPGSIHKPSYLCLDGSLVTIGLVYSAPSKTTLNTLVSAPLVAHYTLRNENGVQKITSMSITYDIAGFMEQSAKNGIPVH
jgi:hypothetical protein